MTHYEWFDGNILMFIMFTLLFNKRRMNEQLLGKRTKVRKGIRDVEYIDIKNIEKNGINEWIRQVVFLFLWTARVVEAHELTVVCDTVKLGKLEEESLFLIKRGETWRNRLTDFWRLRYYQFNYIKLFCVCLSCKIFI